MVICEIEIKNFKSFEDVWVKLSNFNVIVGDSASGKSNFVEVFQFLKDICDDFDAAMNAHGGHNLQNINLRSAVPFCIKATIGNGEPFLTRGHDSNEIQYTSIEYELCIAFNGNSSPDINETVRFSFRINDDENSLVLINQDRRISAGFENDNLDLEDFIPKSLLSIVNGNLAEKQGLIINSPLAAVPFLWSDYFKSINYYNFDSKFCRLDDGRGKAVLGEYGQNLPAVLENILNDKENRRTFLNLVSILIPYVEDIEVFKLEDGRRMFRLSEKYSDEPVLSSFVSDGTMHMLALIAALYFETGDIILIEGPERNIHPALFMQLVSMIKEVSDKKQVIITTHSPEILNFCDLADIHLITRNDEGFSRITNPVDKGDIKEFIDGLGIGQVFVDGYLDFGIE